MKSRSYARPGAGDCVGRMVATRRAPDCSVQREAERMLEDPAVRDAFFSAMERAVADEETARVWASLSELERAVLVVQIDREVPVELLSTFSLSEAAVFGLDDLEASA